ncbi:MAG TPA: glycosyltransferase family 2 protein [Burkholderiaceae bacterium]|nr:glycosyltransferase family 2 protein [Burkholderiaceae bacterium]
MNAVSVPALAVVVPVHNEADNVLPLLEEIQAVLEGRLEYEVLYVDDASSDDTARQLTDAAQRFPRLRVFRHRTRAGQSSAIATGVRRARAALIATLDGDGQNDPADIAMLLRCRAAETASSPGPLLIVGWRRERHDTWLRRVSSRIANGYRSRLLGDATPDTGCGLKLFERETFLQLPFFDHMHRFLPALFLRQGSRVLSVPVRHRPRLRGRSHYGVSNRLWVGLVDVAGVAWLRRRMQQVTVEAVVDREQREQRERAEAL